MDVTEDFPEGKALLDPLEEGLQVGPAAILPVFLGQSQELEAVQGGSQKDISKGEGTATEPQLTLLPWSGRERSCRVGQEASALPRPPLTPLSLIPLSACHSVSPRSFTPVQLGFCHILILPLQSLMRRSSLGGGR